MDNFLEILQDFKENNFQYKNTLNNCFSSLPASHADKSVVGVWFLLSYDYNRIYQIVNNSYRGKVSVARQIWIE